MPIQHIVSFAFNPSTPQSTQDQVKDRFFALGEQCLLPEQGFGEDAGKKYITELKSGPQYSEETHHKGFEQVYILTFKNKEQWRYYVGPDPTKPYDSAHAEFKSWLGGLGVLKDILVLDFDDEVWGNK